MRIIKRRKGKKEYFYLQHSIRKKGKVMTKEKYLGGKIPRNIEKIIEEFKRELREDIYKKLEKIKKNFQAEWGRHPRTVKEGEKEEIAIDFTYNTNAIEGSTITLEEARGIIHDKISPNKSLDEIKETEAHSKVFLRMLDKKENVANSPLLRWHKEIFGETKPEIAGMYRVYSVRIGKYVAPNWRKVKSMMAQLISFIRKSKMNPVELSARAHYRFEKIHPFGDGNGRIGRLIMNHLLWHKSYPMLIIEYKKRASYYKALQKNEEGFVDYFLKLFLAVHKELLYDS